MKYVGLDFFDKEKTEDNILESSPSESFDILALDNPKKQEYLREYRLDIDSVKAFRKCIKIVSEEEANELGKNLLDKLASNYRVEIMPLIICGANVNYIDPATGDFPLLLSTNKPERSNFLDLLSAGANINLQNTITYDLSKKNCIRQLFAREVVKTIRHELLLFVILLSLKVKITEEDYQYFLSFKDEPAFKLLMHKISSVYPNIVSAAKQNNVSSSKIVFNSVSSTDLIEEATKKLEKIKQDNIFENVDNQKKKVLK